jgi:ABC-type methionine transport system permease subunit
VHAASAVANGIGTALPFVVLLVVVAGVARLIWRRRPHHPRPASTVAGE